jgi:hypothetical protein
MAAPKRKKKLNTYIDIKLIKYNKIILDLAWQKLEYSNGYKKKQRAQIFDFRFEIAQDYFKKHFI